MFLKHSIINGFRTHNFLTLIKRFLSNVCKPKNVYWDVIKAVDKPVSSCDSCFNLTEAVGQAQQATANKFQEELVQMQRLQEKLQAELAEARKKLSQERWVEINKVWHLPTWGTPYN